jgi:hypothetical protein
MRDVMVAMVTMVVMVGRREGRVCKEQHHGSCDQYFCHDHPYGCMDQ